MNIQTLFRQIYRFRTYFLVNAVGLSLAFISVLLILAYVWNEFSYDRFHKNTDRIVRVTLNSNTGKSSLVDARVSGDLVLSFKKNFPEIESYSRISSWRKATVIIDDKAFYDKFIYSVDTGFFNFFSFKVLTGNTAQLFSKSSELAISRSMAKTYFGTTDVIGKQVKIMYQYGNKAMDFTIQAVFKDFPANSHLKADFLCSFPQMNHPPGWTYSYLLLKPKTNYKLLQSKIQSYMDSVNAKQETKPIYNLQPITDIHFYSHKSSELKQNANIQSILLLISAALIILIIALINFANLSYVQFLSNGKNRFIRIVNGASKASLNIDFLKEIVVLLLVVIFLSMAAISYISEKYSLVWVNNLPEKLSVLFAIGFISLVVLFAFLPSLLWGNTKKSTLVHKRIYNFSLIIQLSLSIAAIIASIIIQRQINLINKLHPQALNSHIILIPENAGAAVYKYSSFKESLLKHPEIIAVTAASEPPARVVTDDFKFSYDHRKVDEQKTLNTLVIDTNFFNFFNIKPLAGTLSLKNKASLEWQRNELKLLELNYMKKEVPAGLREKVKGYSDKFILNKEVLKVIGIDKARDAIGKSFRLIHPMEGFFPEGTIVGVVNDFHYTNMFVEEEPLVMVYRNLFCHNFLISFQQGNRQQALDIVKTEWENIYPDIPLQFEFVTERYKRVYKREYNEIKVLVLFSIISILLSLAGIFATLNFNLKMRTKEIGIRKVNGATVLEITKMLNADFLRIVLMAFVLAVPFSYYAMTKWLENFAYKTELSWWVFVLGGIIATAITFITVSWQTIKIARVNPVESLKYE